MKHAAFGIFIRSGKATAVLLTAAGAAPQIIERRMVSLADPSVPDSFQPYHVFETRSGSSAERVVEKLKAQAAAIAAQSIGKLVNDARRAGYQPDRAVLVVGSKIDPQTLKNEHIRWHALEGRLFRNVVESALASHSIPCSVVTSKEVFKFGAKVLKRQEEDLKRQVRDLGRSMGSWRAEDKAASLAAWLGLAGNRIAQEIP
ncbi:MAG TPA: hypothetical protein VLR94_03240 [Acidobacteriota bacterium]|nr:hypothetical protein [Acidobacteriota bacterium]